jgi:hypothetical protein
MLTAILRLGPLHDVERLGDGATVLVGCPLMSSYRMFDSPISR